MSTEETVTIPIVRFFEKLEDKLDRISDKLDSKADRSSVEALEHRTKVLEQGAASAESVERYRRWLLALACMVMGLVVAVAGLILRGAGI
jgi:lipopolysaccharide export LptBFGC system permease protein LptF